MNVYNKLLVIQAYNKLLVIQVYNKLLVIQVYNKLLVIQVYNKLLVIQAYLLLTRLFYNFLDCYSHGVCLYQKSVRVWYRTRLQSSVTGFLMRCQRHFPSLFSYSPANS